MRRNVAVGAIVVCSASFAPGAVLADVLDVPHEFTAGTTASAAEVNENFSAAETAVDDNDSRITANANDIADITTVVQGLGPPIAVFDGNGDELGLLLSGLSSADGPGRVTVLGEQGYSFVVEMATGEIRESFRPLYYATPDCSGALYTYRPAGTVFRSSTDSALYYVERSSTPVSISNGSYRGDDGTCFDLATLEAAWPAFPNAFGVTGVSDEPHPLPLKIGQP